MNAMTDTPRMADVVLETEAEFNLAPGSLYSCRRKRSIAWPRFAAMHVCYRTLGKSLPEVGRFFGRHHTTVMDGVRRAEEIRAADADYDHRLQEVAAKFATPVFIRDCNKPIFKTRRNKQ